MGHPEFEELKKNRGEMTFPGGQVGGRCCAARPAAGSSQCTKPAVEEEQ